MPICMNYARSRHIFLPGVYVTGCLHVFGLAFIRNLAVPRNQMTQTQHTTAIHRNYSKQNWFVHLTSWEYGATHVRSTVFWVNNLAFRNCQKKSDTDILPVCMHYIHGYSHIQTIFVNILFMCTIFVNVHCMLWNVDWRTKYCGSEKQVSWIDCLARDTWSLVTQAWIWLCKKKRVSLFVAVSFDVVEYLFCDRVIMFLQRKVGFTFLLNRLWMGDICVVEPGNRMWSVYCFAFVLCNHYNL